MSGKSHPKRAHAADKPLAGERVLITRTKDQAGSLANELEALGAAVLEIPVIEIRPPASYVALDATLSNIENYDWLVLTSVNGVEALFARMQTLGFGPEKLLHLNIAAIGPATEEAIEVHGLPVDVVPLRYVAESVVEALRDQVRGKRVLLVRAKVARDVIPEELRKAGSRVHVVEAYETVAPEESRARLRKALEDSRERPTAITFTSSSTARNFVTLLGSEDPAQTLRGITIASIGPVTSATLRELGMPVDVEATEYTIPGLVKALAARK
jgi:uroporphyrinogen-III synthase